MAVIEIEHLKKHYGKHVGTRDVTFSVDEGEIFGFLGPNGAGKTTTLKILMGFVLKSGGSATICGLDVERDTRKIKAFTGYVPSDVRLYANMRVKELLRRNAAFYPGDSAGEADRLCALFEADKDKRLRELSSGNKKKVSIICALMARPRVVILDEPTNGLDPVMQKLLFEELKRHTAGGATVLLSSHNLAEVQEYCRRVAFIKDGAILAVADLSEAAEPKKILSVAGGAQAVPDGLEFVKHDGDRRVFRSGLEGRALLRALSEIGPDDFTVENERMEERFWHLYGQEEDK
jgi:ABC-2 type transport system ATP-binding protein